MSSITGEAHKNWATRKADETFATFDELQTAVDSRQKVSAEQYVALSGIMAYPTHDDDIQIQTGLDRHHKFTNWSFGQFCRSVGVPAEYLKRVPTRLAVDCLNDGISHTVRESIQDAEDRTKELNVFSRTDGGDSTIRAVTSERYGRIYDGDVLRKVRSLIDGTSFRNPVMFNRHIGGMSTGGLFASDRDMYILVCDRENPIEVRGEQLFRTAIFKNSEVGAASLRVWLGMVRDICQNLTISGVKSLYDLSVKHLGSALERMNDKLPRVLERLAIDDGSRERTMVSAAMDYQVGKDDTEVLSWLRNNTSLPVKTANKVIELAKTEENGAGTLWQIANGITAYARSIPYRDERAALEMEAGKILENLIA